MIHKLSFQTWTCIVCVPIIVICLYRLYLEVQTKQHISFQCPAGYELLTDHRLAEHDYTCAKGLIRPILIIKAN